MSEKSIKNFTRFKFKVSWYFLISFVALFFLTCKTGLENEETVKIAFIADVHLQNVYGKFTDTDYKGVLNPKSGEYAIIRTMASQLKSTRLFNENYFAFHAALNDIARKGVKFVALPGDFSDDGQALNVRGLKIILDEYTEKYEMQFFVTTGNHDPVRPFLRHGGKKDFLGTEGKRQPIYSKRGMYKPNKNEHPLIVSSDVAEMGYQGIASILAEFGFFPKQEYIYWETPFSSYSYSSYEYDAANEESSLENRYYTMPNSTLKVPDVSYVVEPVEDVWLLAIDANVYLPVGKPNNNNNDPGNYRGTSIGYNNVLTHKKHLINWVENVAVQAKQLNKKLIAFSHYPMVDFHNSASPEIENLLGYGKLQTHRVPLEEVARVFADAGVQIHFAGHLHVNDTGVRKTEKSNTVVNVQIPSLAAYIPAYKLLTIHQNNKLEIETIVVDSVPGFNSFFDLYQQEHNFLVQSKYGKIWNKDVLTSKSYLEFTKWHIQELVRLRFMPDDWSGPFGKQIRQHSGAELLVLSQMNESSELRNGKTHVAPDNRKIVEFEKAVTAAKIRAEDASFLIEDFDQWNGEDMLLDFYKLRNADELAFNDIGIQRLKQYQLIVNSFLENSAKLAGDELFGQLVEFSSVLNKLMNGKPSCHFMIEMEEMSLVELNKNNEKNYPQ